MRTRRDHTNPMPGRHRDQEFGRRRGAKFLQQGAEIRQVRRRRVFPVEVDPVETVLPAELDQGLDQRGPLGRIRAHVAHLHRPILDAGQDLAPLRMGDGDRVGDSTRVLHRQRTVGVRVEDADVHDVRDVLEDEVADGGVVEDGRIQVRPQVPHDRLRTGLSRGRFGRADHRQTEYERNHAQREPLPPASTKGRTEPCPKPTLGSATGINNHGGS